MKMNELKVGTRVRFSRTASKAIENFELDLSDLTGTVIVADHDVVAVRLDMEFEDLADHDNAVVYTDDAYGEGTEIDQLLASITVDDGVR